MVVELIIERLVMVDDAALAMMPPLKVANPVKVEAPVTSRVDDRFKEVID